MVERKKNISSVVDSIIKSSKSKQIDEIVKPKKTSSKPTIASAKVSPKKQSQLVEDAPKRVRKKTVEVKAEILKENLKKVVSKTKASKDDNGTTAVNLKPVTSAIVTRSEPTVEEIQLKAYLIWEREGCQHGKDKLYWDMAVEELRVKN